MFTGIIREIGELAQRVEKPDGVECCVRAVGAAERCSPGDSIAVSGVCQTVETVVGDTITFTAVGETLRRTTLSDLGPGSRVNLEHPATLATALGGHLVQGHVDGVGRVERFEQVETTGATQPGDRYLTIALPHAIFMFAVEKGSITIDGVSLTIAGVGSGKTVTITIIPYTLRETIIGEYQIGTSVNIEVDIVAKYVRHFVMNDEFDREGLLRHETKDVLER